MIDADVRQGHTREDVTLDSVKVPDFYGIVVSVQ